MLDAIPPDLSSPTAMWIEAGTAAIALVAVATIVVTLVIRNRKERGHGDA